MAIDESSVDQVRRAADIVTVVGEYLKLKRRGKNHIGLCPFHQEKTPSFNVNQERQFYHCFGCGASGDVFSFVMEQENLEFPEAVRQLAQRFGVELRETGQSGGQKKERDRLLTLMEKAVVVYQRSLNAASGEAGRRFLDQRKIAQEQRQGFGIGYAPPGWQFLADQLIRQGATEDLLVKAGLCARSQRSGKIYDRLRNRVVFPVRDERGRVVGFGGRDLSGEAETPKYVNSPETPLYHKGSLLYGLDLARKNLREKPALLVEGYLDVVSLRSAGFGTAVAPLGTALTEEQAKLLGRFTRDHGVIVFFDGDSAGQTASLKALVPLINAGLPVRVASPPEGKDPDDLIRESGADTVAELIEQAQSGDDFLIEQLALRYELDTTAGRHGLINELVELLPRFVERTTRDLLIERFAKLLRVSVGDLRRDLRRLYKGQPLSQSNAPAVEASRPIPQMNRDWGVLLWLLFNDKNSGFDIMDAEVKVEQFPAKLAPVVEYAYNELEEGRLPEIAPLLSQLESDVRSILMKIINIEMIDEEQQELALRDCRIRIEIKSNKHRIAKLKIQYGDPEHTKKYKDTILREITTLNRRNSELDSMLGYKLHQSHILD